MRDLVGRLCDRAAALEKGRPVEDATVEKVIDTPSQPCPRRLVAATPVPDPREQARRREVRAAETVR